MSTYTQILYQFVFTTKNRKDTLDEEGHEKLFRFIWGILKDKNCHLYRINGTMNHLHIVTHVHPMIAPALLIKDIKLAASEFIKKENLFPSFDGWQEGYGAFTYAFSAKDNLIEYVKNQKAHHLVISFKEEYIKLLLEHGIEFDVKYLM
jgi:REP element-mobilizing transposase RayT